MLDITLAVLLIFVVPLVGVWRSRRADDPSASRSARYIRTMATIGGLLTVLAACWTVGGRDLNELGLGVPTSPAALAGLAIATLLLAVLFLVSRLKRTSRDEAAETSASALLPRTRGEIALFVPFAIAVGFGWEVLYRGFLFSYLLPYAGLAGAIVVAAAAYGLAHGLKSTGQFLGSLASALVFTVGYALTHSLWWLILLHIGLPLIAAFSTVRAVAEPQAGEAVSA